ncbi:MAG: Ig-like domain-containing protein [Deltaproteobacteria bacterium]|nr:Ig-like domain-containing protein [Deltaproteobacteria bacterium]
MTSSLVIASLIESLAAALSPADAAVLAQQVGRPLPAVIPLQQPVYGSIAYGAGDAPFPIFMNRHGGRYTCGDNDSRTNSSTIACSGGGDVGPWPGSDAEWQSFMACSTDLFSRFNVEITDVEPGSGDYVEAVIGGNPGDVGMPSGVGGVAPYQCGVIPRGIVYAFADVYYGGGNWWRDVCETAAQEVVHAFGLDHEYLCEDPMTYLYGCGEKTFQDTDAQCGEYSPRQCDCTGATQNSVQEMLDLFGPSGPPVDDPDPPTVSLVAPVAGAVLAANTEIQIVANASDGVGLRSVVLEWDYNDGEMACPGSGEHYSCTQSGSTATWTINVGEGARTFRVRATDLGQHTVTTSDRTITLVVGGSSDVQAPVVTIDSPAPGAVLGANQTIDIVADVTDDVAVAEVGLYWEKSDETYPCPFEAEYVTCAVAGSRYTWSLAVSTGARAFHVSATDTAGNSASSPMQSIELVEGGGDGDGGDDGDDGDDGGDGEHDDGAHDGSEPPGIAEPSDDLHVRGGCACASPPTGAPWAALPLVLLVTARAWRRRASRKG